MAILDTETTAISEADRAANRVCPVTVKLTQEEHRAVTEHAEELGQARSEWMRDVILRELQTSSNDPLLEEVVGIRLLLINVLRPLAGGQQIAAEAFDKLLEHVGTRKQEIVQKMVSARRT
ncbi:MAG: hypothetical protein BGO25_10215 [Acidobacteriales bacterium 59-55]|nr:ribbon-helix-helix protein, CopG family [Terriglobales bacterium]OJV42663.1 MAG: hypothetical protein BGO25_10215 [Acidobacteriales bacterium 59-55]